MTLPAALSIAAATLGVIVAGLCWWLSRAPGWQEMKRFALVSLTAGLYCLAESVTTIRVSEATAIAASQFGMVVAAFHGPSWVLYIAAQQRRPARLWEKGLVVVATLVAILAAIPGVIVSGEILFHEVAWLGVTYADAQATPLGATVYGLYCTTLLIPLVVYVREARRGEPTARAHAVGVAFLIVAAVNDALVGAAVYDGPYALAVGFPLAVAATGGSMLRRFLEQAQKLEVLSRDLETMVAQRSDQLARTQDALVRSEKLASLGRLAAGAAHEINNPCSVVSTNLAYLRLALTQQGALPDDAERCLDESIDAADRIARIIRHLVDAGRTGGSARIDMHRFPVRDAVEKALASAKISLKGFACLDVEGEPAVQAQGDPALLQQIMVNLVINAAHAVEAREVPGRVTVRIGHQNGHVLIDVEDEGVGIDPPDLARVFEPFFTTKRPGHGMGLGLAVSLGLARAQGGDISVLTTSPRGTTMRVTLCDGESDPPSARRSWRPA
jgi:signal transduction histidine kinase